MTDAKKPAGSSPQQGTHHKTTTRPIASSSPKAAPADEKAVGVDVETLAAIFVLDGLRGFGPQKFKTLHAAHIDFRDLLRHPDKLPLKGKNAEKLKTLLRRINQQALDTCAARAERQIVAAARLGARILTYRSPEYPKAVFASNYPVAVLFVRGSLPVLQTPSFVACVGSRAIREPYADLHKEFAKTACVQHLGIVSGFALGADTLGHEAALRSAGTTVCVMPGGLDRPFPPENRWLWDELLRCPRAAFVSEFSFGTIASALTLRKRNKSIVAFAGGVLVSQSSAKGGAMNAYRFAIEQKKPVATFAHDGQADTSGNAQIATGQNTKISVTVFDGRVRDTRKYVEWLHRL